MKIGKLEPREAKGGTLIRRLTAFLRFQVSGQARWWEILLLWVLLSLVSISFVGDHPYVALGIAALGGVYLGWQVTVARRA